MAAKADNYVRLQKASEDLNRWVAHLRGLRHDRKVAEATGDLSADLLEDIIDAEEIVAKLQAVYSAEECKFRKGA